MEDLPPKIIQDFYCDLSPLQTLLYEDFSHSTQGKKLREKIEKDEEEEEEGSGGDHKPKHHVLQVPILDSGRTCSSVFYVQ